MYKNYNFLFYMFLLILLFSCFDKNQNESLVQKLDTTIVKVDLPLGENHYDSTFFKKMSDFYIIIGSDTSDFITHVRERNTGAVSIYFDSRKNKIGRLIDTILFDSRFKEFEYLLTEIEKDYILDSLDGVSFPTLFKEVELEKSLSEVYIKTYESGIVKGRNDNYDRTEYVLLHSLETIKLDNLLKKYSVKIAGFSLEIKIGIYERIGPERDLTIDSTNSRFIEKDTTGRPKMFIPYHTAFAKFKRNVKH